VDAVYFSLGVSRAKMPLPGPCIWTI